MHLAIRRERQACQFGIGAASDLTSTRCTPGAAPGIARALVPLNRDLPPR
jgi:hypothetical protein